MPATPSPTQDGLRRNLSVVGAIGISIALMAPSMAANLTPQVTGSIVGRAVPLSFLLSLVGVLLIAYGFVRLTQHFHHAGSAYAFVGATLGARAGVVAGWALLGTYTLFAVLTAAASGIFANAFLEAIGLWHHASRWVPFLVAIVPLAGAWALAAGPTRSATRALLTVEGATVALILVVSVVVLVRVIVGSAPGDQSFTLSVFSPQPGDGFSAIFKGAIFGFLAFAGFEAAATLGEETREPRRAIPKAILGTALIGGAYFVFVTAVEVLGFGTDQQGVTAFVSSGSLLGDLGRQYVAGWVGDVITLGTAISAFACVLASTVAATRLLFAFSRDGLGPAAASRVSQRTGAPVGALVVVAGLSGLILYVLAFSGAQPIDVFAWLGTIGVLTLLAVYALTALGALRLTFGAARDRIRPWESVFPVLALVVIGFTYHYNVDLHASGAALWNPIVAGIWLLLGVALVIAFPGVSRRVGAGLANSEGLATAGAPSEPVTVLRDTTPVA